MILLNAAVEYAAIWIRNPKHMKLLQRSFETVLPLRSHLFRHGTRQMIGHLRSLINIVHILLQESVEHFGPCRSYRYSKIWRF